MGVAQPRGGAAPPAASPGYDGLDEDLPLPVLEDGHAIQHDPGAAGAWGVHVSSCGHFMHLDCYERFMRSATCGSCGARAGH